MKIDRTEATNPDSARRVADFVATTCWDGLPEPVQRKARMCLLDNLGVTLAGTLTPVSRIAAAHAAESWRGEEATILLHGRRASPAGAAFANAWTANALDIDDGARYAFGHAGAQVFPTALAMAESRGLGGARLLTALVTGYEVAHRAGRCWHDSRPVYQACGSWGSIASAAAAANLLDLTPEQAWHALGIADYLAPNVPMMRDIDHPGMVKHGIGWGAMTGVTAAQTAGRGFTGVPCLLAFDRYTDWVRDIGHEFIMVDGVVWKPYGCCSYAHAAMNGAKQLVDQHDIILEDVTRILVEGPHETSRLGARIPTTTEEAQFSVAWPVAAYLTDGELGPEQMLDERFGDPRILNLARKVEVVESDELNELCRLRVLGDPRGKFAAIVTIDLADGRSFCSGLAESESQFPQIGWDEARVERKFRWLVGQLLDEQRMNDLVEIVWQMETLTDVRELTRLVA